MTSCKRWIAPFGLAVLWLVITLGGPIAAEAQTPGITNGDEDRSGDISLGDTLRYQIIATNTGNVTLTNLVVSDVLSGGRQNCPSVAPDGQCVLFATYVVKASDINAGRISTSATGQSDQTGTVPLPSPATILLPTPNLSVSIDVPTNRDEDNSGALSVGDTLTYATTATNVGSAVLTEVGVGRAGGEGTAASPPCPMLRPGTLCTVTEAYTVTSDDASRGSVILRASAQSRQTGVVQTSRSVPPFLKPAIHIVRASVIERGPDGTVTPGDLVRLSISVENAGTVPLTNIIVNDLEAAVSDCSIGSLAPGEVDRDTCSGTYVLTQKDIDAGTLSGRALALGQASSQVITAESATNTAGLSIPQAPSLTVERLIAANEDRDSSQGVSEGDLLTFEVAAKNAGNMTLTNVRVGDRLTGAELACGSLAPAGSCRLTFAYAVGGGDVSKGIANLAYAQSDQTGNVRPGQLEAEFASVRLPENFLTGVSGLSDISTDLGVVGTNLTLAIVALATLLVATTVFNSTLEENAAEVEALGLRIAGSRAVAPFLGALGWVASADAGGSSRLVTILKPAILVLLTALIYALLEPDFGFNEETAVLVVALVAGIAVATLLFEGGQVFWASYHYDSPAAMRVYPLAILIAIACVALTRVTNLHPGVIFGFVTAAAIFPRRQLTRDVMGKIVAVPLAALLVTSAIAFFLIDPFRELNLEHSTLWSALPETIAVAVFVGGAQSALLILMPVTFNDGEKIWAWNKLVWFALAVPAAFGFFHVLVNQEEYGGLVDDTDTMTILAICAGVVVISFLTWFYFNVHRSALRNE